MDKRKVLLIIGILLIIISAIFLIFGFRIRELWPTTTNMYEIGIPAIIGTLGVIFFAISSTLTFIYYTKKKIIE